jgi:hypothetical protein
MSNQGPQQHTAYAGATFAPQEKYQDTSEKGEHHYLKLGLHILAGIVVALTLTGGATLAICADVVGNLGRYLLLNHTLVGGAMHPAGGSKGMKLNFNVNGKEDLERLILIINLGVIEAIKNHSLSMQEATNYFLNPYSAQTLEKMGVETSVKDLIYLGCELEDIERIIPDQLSGSLENVKNQAIYLLNNMPKAQLPTKYWLEE